ncbi:EAL domain-containing protein [Saccharospirillum sp.]|uniref:bifunctional diguanylate cyclase/phosphodiesterase n=1 Tax=Saccharospirillum sp. TaxID=2033801 RepID=UPI0034A08DD1
MAVSIHTLLIRIDTDDGLDQLAALQKTIEDDARLLILAFSSAQPDQLVNLMPWVEALWPMATVAGAYGPQIIHQGEISENTLLLQFMTFERTDLRLNYLRWEGDDRELGERLFDPVCRADSRLALTFLGAQHGDVPALTHWVNRHYPNLALIGGCSVNEGEGWLYADGQFLDHHALTITLSNETLDVVTQSYSEWHLIGPTWSVTKAVGNTLYELDQQSAQALYARYLTETFADDRLTSGAQPDEVRYENFPLMRVNDKQHTLSVPLRRLDDGGLIMSTPLLEGDRVRFAYSHPSMTLEQVNRGAESLHQRRPELILSFNCASRQRFDREETERELQPFQTMAPLSGVFCYGELMHQKGRTQLLQHSLVTVAIAEDPAAERPMPVLERHALAPLFRLIQASVEDLDQVNRNLEDDIRRTTQELLRKLETDSLTGLANRVALLQCLRDDDPWPIVQICSLKINNLRQINNLYGYSVGDQLLRSLSASIQTDITELLPTTALVFRGSPNEFLVVAPDACPMNSFYKGMAQLTERMQNQSDLFSDKVVQNVLPILLTAGTAHRSELPPDMTHSTEDLLIKASEARRHAYRHQLPIARAIDLPGTDRGKRDGLNWLSRIRTALGSGDILPYVQPLFDRQGQVHHVEALMRVRHDGVVYSPASFLDLVKPTQLYPRLSMVMIDETFRLMKPHKVGFTLNFTARDLANEALIDRLKYWLKGGVDAERVTLEIVESDSLRNFDRFTYILHELRRLGCKLAIDDFGSAYSNLERVMRLKPDWIKLDGSLIRHLVDSEVNRILVRRVVQLCQDLHIRAVAEHVHDQATLSILMGMGVDFFQGFYLAEPTPAETFNVHKLRQPGTDYEESFA